MATAKRPGCLLSLSELCENVITKTHTAMEVLIGFASYAYYHLHRSNYLPSKLATRLQQPMSYATASKYDPFEQLLECY